MMWLRTAFLWLVTPFIKIIGDIAKPLPEMDSEFLYFIMDKVQPGDILLSESSYNLSNFFIAGRYKHAAMFCGDCIVEAIGDGVVKADFTEWIMHHDHVAVLRPKNLTVEQCARAADVAKKQLGKPYDFTFNNSDKEFYCSELVRYAYEKDFGKGIIGDYGVDVFPTNYYKNTRFFEIIAEC